MDPYLILSPSNAIILLIKSVVGSFGDLQNKETHLSLQPIFFYFYRQIAYGQCVRFCFYTRLWNVICDYRRVCEIETSDVNDTFLMNDSNNKQTTLVIDIR